MSLLDSVLNTVLKTADSSHAVNDPADHFQGTWLGTWKGLAFFGGVSVAAAAIGGRVASRKSNKRWYHLLRKSSLTPPDTTFSIVWPVLYTLGAVSAWRVAKTEPSAARTKALSLWGVQIVANAAWTPLFFGAHRPKLAMADLAVNQFALSAYAREARKIDKTAAAMVVPNIGWLMFAGKLNRDVNSKVQFPGLVGG